MSDAAPPATARPEPGSAAPSAAPPTFERRRPRRRGRRVVVVIVVTLGAALFGSRFVVKAFKVPSPSMEPTIAVGDRILMEKGAGAPSVGDIVVLHPPADALDGGEPCASGAPRTGRACEAPSREPASEVSFVQRVVAGPGDRVAMEGGRVLRNGRADDAAPASPCTARECSFAEFTMPASHWFTLGDNRGNSLDGRFFGPVPTERIRGPIVARYWPLSRAGGL